MICPHCNAQNELTWKRYWMSPLGRHVCTECHTKFRMAHTFKYYSVLAGVWCVMAIIVAYIAEHFHVNSILAYLVYALVGSLVTFPLDRKIDNTWRGTKLR